MVDDAFDVLTGAGSLAGFGQLLHRCWLQKRELDRSVSTRTIDDLYQRGIEAGALGGKLLGAGGGGFMLFMVPCERQERFRSALKDHHEVSFAINAPGSAIVHS
jgi:D-glycero-alpha-D-manno-heptose-7-phosphate kinase